MTCHADDRSARAKVKGELLDYKREEVLEAVFEGGRLPSAGMEGEAQGPLGGGELCEPDMILGTRLILAEQDKGQAVLFDLEMGELGMRGQQGSKRGLVMRDQ
jgi:hypothetical protein